MKLLINFVAFQAGWFACVLGAANELPGVGVGVVTAAVALHLSMAQRPWQEIRLLLIVGAIGAIFDTLLLSTGWVDYPHGKWLGPAAPFWIISMWVLFGTTLNVSLSWLRPGGLLAMAVGAIAGPLSYLAGEKLGAIQFVAPMPAVAALSAGWALALSALVRIASFLDGFKPMPGPQYAQEGRRVSQHV